MHNKKLVSTRCLAKGKEIKIGKTDSSRYVTYDTAPWTCTFIKKSF